MMAWWFLLGAIAAEVAATLGLKVATVHRWVFGFVAAGYVTAFVLLSYALAYGMPIGVAYGLWTAFGVALTALFARWIFAEPLTRRMMAGIGLIIVGVLCVELGA